MERAWEGPTLEKGARPYLSKVVTPLVRSGAPPDEGFTNADDSGSGEDAPLAPPLEDDGPVLRAATGGVFFFFIAAALVPTLLPGVAARHVLLAAMALGVSIVVVALAAASLLQRVPLWVTVFLVCGCLGGLLGGVVGDAVGALPALRALRAALHGR
jgi:hypothetical protein